MSAQPIEHRPAALSISTSPSASPPPSPLKSLSNKTLAAMHVITQGGNGEKTSSHLLINPSPTSTFSGRVKKIPGFNAPFLANRRSISLGNFPSRSGITVSISSPTPTSTGEGLTPSPTRTEEGPTPSRTPESSSELPETAFNDTLPQLSPKTPPRETSKPVPSEGTPFRDYSKDYAAHVSVVEIEEYFNSFPFQTTSTPRAEPTPTQDEANISTTTSAIPSSSSGPATTRFENGPSSSSTNLQPHVDVLISTNAPEKPHDETKPSLILRPKPFFTQPKSRPLSSAFNPGPVLPIGSTTLSTYTFTKPEETSDLATATLTELPPSEQSEHLAEKSTSTPPTSPAHGTSMHDDSPTLTNVALPSFEIEEGSDSGFESNGSSTPVSQQPSDLTFTYEATAPNLTPTPTSITATIEYEGSESTNSTAPSSPTPLLPIATPVPNETLKPVLPTPGSPIRPSPETTNTPAAAHSPNSRTIAVVPDTSSKYPGIIMSAALTALTSLASCLYTLVTKVNPAVAAVSAAVSTVALLVISKVSDSLHAKHPLLAGTVRTVGHALVSAASITTMVALKIIDKYLMVGLALAAIAILVSDIKDLVETKKAIKKIA